MKIETKYSILDRVWIQELRVPATILAIYIGETGTQYSLRYFGSGDAKTTYFYESEIADLPQSEKLGFE